MGASQSSDQPQPQPAPASQPPPPPPKPATRVTKRRVTRKPRPSPTKPRKAPSKKAQNRDPSTLSGPDQTVIVRRRTKKVAIKEPSSVAEYYHFTKASDGSRVSWRIGQVPAHTFVENLSGAKETFLKRSQITILFQVSNFDKQAQGTLTQYIRVPFSSRTGFTLQHLIACMFDAAVATAVVSIKEQYGRTSVKMSQVREYLLNRVIPKIFVNPGKGMIYVPVMVATGRRP
jgi:hypothetical protein